VDRGAFVMKALVPWISKRIFWGPILSESLIPLPKLDDLNGLNLDQYLINTKVVEVEATGGVKIEAVKV
jgi:hypothetical protein